MSSQRRSHETWKRSSRRRARTEGRMTKRATKPARAQPTVEHRIRRTAFFHYPTGGKH